MRTRLLPWLTPCFWLVVPILVMNVVYAADLPAMFQPEVFNAGIPAVIALPENVLRVLLFVLTAFLPMRAHRAGWVVFLVGSALYAGSWAALIAAPHASWSTSLAGRLAPACTPALWLAGIGMIADRPAFSKAPRARWLAVYAVLAVGFLAAHVSHTALVALR